MCNPSHNPSFSNSTPNGPGLMQVVTGAISLEDQNTLPETAQNEVDPRPFQMLPPDFHLTQQTTPPLLPRVRKLEVTVLAHLVPPSYLELAMREQLEVVQSLP